MENEVNILFDISNYSSTWLYSNYPKLGNMIDLKFKKKWELDRSSVVINDYGLSNYKGRKIATYITDVNFRLMNRDLGEYESHCMCLGIIADSKFSRWREPEEALCKFKKDKNLLDIYKKRLNFQSLWNVE